MTRALGTSTASRTATRTATKTSTEAFTQGNVTVTGGAGAGATNVRISVPRGKAMRPNAGAKLKAPITSFADADAFYKANTRRAGDAAKFGHNTVLVPHYGTHQNLDGYSVRLHNTNIVTIYHNGIVELDAGGWRTATTLARMNAVLEPFNIFVAQRAGKWYVSEFTGEGESAKLGNRIEFFDGMQVAVERERAVKRNPSQMKHIVETVKMDNGTVMYAVTDVRDGRIVDTSGDKATAVKIAKRFDKMARDERTYCQYCGEQFKQKAGSEYTNTCPRCDVENRDD